MSNPDHDELLKKDTQRMKRQDTLQDGMMSQIAELEGALHDVGEKHEVLFIGEEVMNCRKLAGMLNMQPGISCKYDEIGAEVDPETDTIVLATHDPVVVTRVRQKANGADVVIMSTEGVPEVISEMFPDCFIAWNFPAAFGHITKAVATGS